MFTDNELTILARMFADEIKTASGPRELAAVILAGKMARYLKRDHKKTIAAFIADIFPPKEVARQKGRLAL